LYLADVVFDLFQIVEVEEGVLDAELLEFIELR
jgi:hypothetical protein